MNTTRKKTLLSRLRAKLRRAPNGCLEWTGATNGRGYGQMWRDGRVSPSHRIVYELAYGPIPEGLVVDHLCHNRGCCEPTHLRLVTDALNKQNRAGAQRNSKTGARGVMVTENGRYKGRVQLNGKQYYSERFDTVEEAAEAAAILRAKYHAAIPEI